MAIEKLKKEEGRRRMRDQDSGATNKDTKGSERKTDQSPPRRYYKISDAQESKGHAQKLRREDKSKTNNTGEDYAKRD